METGGSPPALLLGSLGAGKPKLHLQAAERAQATEREQELTVQRPELGCQLETAIRLCKLVLESAPS